MQRRTHHLSPLTLADIQQQAQIILSPSRVRYQGQGLVIDRSQSPAQQSGTVCLLRCERQKTTNGSKSF